RPRCGNSWVTRGGHDEGVHREGLPREGRTVNKSSANVHHLSERRMSTVGVADHSCPHCRRPLALVKPVCGKTATCHSCGGTFEAKRWMVVASWTSCFVLVSLALSLTLVIACPLVCWLVEREWWVGLAAAGALIVPLVKIGGRLGMIAGGMVANKCG